MKYGCILIVILLFLAVPVSAMEFTAPVAPDEAQVYMPKDTESFGEGLWYILKTAIGDLRPEITTAFGTCLALIAVVILLNIAGVFTQKATQAIHMTGTVMIGIILLEPMNALVRLGTQTITQLGEYGKLLIPVMTAALAAQGGTTTSAVLCAGTVFFNSLLTSFITKLLIPVLYVYLCLCIANHAIGQDILKTIQQFTKWLMTWILKCILYIFTGYIGITGVVSGAVDASAIKATKLAISGMVPVVGGILSDASEAVLVSAGVMKSAAGVYGILAVIAICIGPFLQIGIQYVLLKLTAGICGMFSGKPAGGLIGDVSAGMGMILAMTGTVCLLLLISVVCFMRGIG